MNKSKIRLHEIEKIIPMIHYLSPQENLAKLNTEWCLTKYSINNKIYITIRIKHPDNDQTIYINENGDIILFDMDTKYDKYIKEKIYWYTKQTDN